MGDYISVTDTAKRVKADLKKAFPQIRFSVRSKKYSGGSSIDVDWTAGPTEKQVEGVAGKYHGAEFDGMIDLKSRTGAPYANDYIFFQRDMPDVVVSAVMRDMREAYGIPAEYENPDRGLDEKTQELLRAVYHRPIFTLREAARAHLGQTDLSDGYDPVIHAPRAGIAPAERETQAAPPPVVPAAGRHVYLERMKKRLAAYEQERPARLSR